MNNKRKEIIDKVELLNKAARAYYQDGREIMPNIEYDKLYDELKNMEEETGIVMSGSPTQNVGYEVVSELPKEEHALPMLSLDKTKERKTLADRLSGGRSGLLSLKMDGLTIVLTYESGKLVKALTRGNGVVGEVVTQNAVNFMNLPVSIPYKGELIIRGEAVIKYSDFEAINREIGDADAKYKNARNLCSGSVRQLDPAVTRQRRVNFYAFAIVSVDKTPAFIRHSEEFEWLSDQGFDVVESREVSEKTVVEAIDDFQNYIVRSDIPSDGLVLIYDDIEYGMSLGRTAKFFRDAIAFKWQDQQEETSLIGIEWNASRTGLINPVAVFDPVELEGTTVSRASVHNVSVMRQLELGIGDRILVYKANMIIPQIAENLTKSGNAPLPETCPVCECKAELRSENGVETLHCLNKNCPAKHLKSFVHFVSREGMNIEGLSEATLEKFISKGLIKEFADIYRINRHRSTILSIEGFGEKSYDNLIMAVERSRDTTVERLLNALGIPGIGATAARLISCACDGEWCKIENIDKEELMMIDGIGVVLADAYVTYFNENSNKTMLSDLVQYMNFKDLKTEKKYFLEGITFVITGSLNGFANRAELKSKIEKAGGRVSSSVSAKTSYLVNNDITSFSSKNKKAKELGIPIIDEEKIAKWLSEGKKSDSD